MQYTLISKNYPTHSFKELMGMFVAKPDLVHTFEKQLGDCVQAPHIVLFPHARVAIQAAIAASEIALPSVLVTAYSCVVVGHAILLAGFIHLLNFRCYVQHFYSGDFIPS